jgi:probable H4MPT-linked C1 transfer pathway protein
MASVIGWDIGGAHVKAARVENGRVADVAMIPCAPHLGLSHLETAIAAAAERLGPAPLHAVTMTAELSDAFESRERGVTCVAAMLALRIAGANVRFYAGAKGFLSKADVPQAAEDIASANWRASAELVAREVEDALFIDMGSTTTDIIPIRSGAVAALGANDAGRLAHGELVYTGLLRGRPGAGAPRAPVDGRWTPLVDEAFATMADAHRILGAIPDGADQLPTSDGRSKSIEDSRARLARLVGRDASQSDPSRWDALAEFFARVQLRAIEDAIDLIASRGGAEQDARVIGAGIGRRVIARWSRSRLLPYRDISEFIRAEPQALAAASDSAPAVAVALLLAGR